MKDADGKPLHHVAFKGVSGQSSDASHGKARHSGAPKAGGRPSSSNNSRRSARDKKKAERRREGGTLLVWLLAAGVVLVAVALRLWMMSNGYNVRDLLPTHEPSDPSWVWPDLELRSQFVERLTKLRGKSEGKPEAALHGDKSIAGGLLGEDTEGSDAGHTVRVLVPEFMLANFQKAYAEKLRKPLLDKHNKTMVFDGVGLTSWLEYVRKDAKKHSMSKYDMYALLSTWIPTFVEKGMLADMTDLLTHVSSTYWDDVLPQIRENVAIYNNKIYALPMDGDGKQIQTNTRTREHAMHGMKRHMHATPHDATQPDSSRTHDELTPLSLPVIMMMYNERILKEHKLSPPKTWQEWIETSKKLHGLDLNGDGIPDSGSCLITEPNGFMSPFFFAVAAPFLQTYGSEEGIFFNPNNMKPKFALHGYANILNLYRQMMDHSIYAMEGLVTWEDTVSMFVQERCALTYNFNGILKMIVTDPDKDTSHFKMAMIPGTKVVVADKDGDGGMENCTLQRCPFADADGVNRAPFYGEGGIGLALNAHAQPDVGMAALSFAISITGPENSLPLVTSRQGWLDTYRYSHFKDLDDPKSDTCAAYFADGWSHETLLNWRDVTMRSFEHRNGVRDLAIYGKPEYAGASGIESRIARFISDPEMTPQETLDDLVRMWDTLTYRYGKSIQLNLYRKSLDLPTSQDTIPLVIMCIALVLLLGLIGLVFRNKQLHDELKANTGEMKNSKWKDLLSNNPAMRLMTVLNGVKQGKKPDMGEISDLIILLRNNGNDIWKPDFNTSEFIRATQDNKAFAEFLRFETLSQGKRGNRGRKKKGSSSIAASFRTLPSGDPKSSSGGDSKGSFLAASVGAGSERHNNSVDLAEEDETEYETSGKSYASSAKSYDTSGMSYDDAGILPPAPCKEDAMPAHVGGVDGDNVASTADTMVRDGGPVPPHPPHPAAATFFTMFSGHGQEPCAYLDPHNIKRIGDAGSWDLNVFELDEATKGHPLLTLVYNIFHSEELLGTLPGNLVLQDLRVNTDKFWRYIQVIEAGMSPAYVYHNACHVTDVTNSMCWFLREGQMADRMKLSQLEVFAAIFAAAIHDYNHPGVTNDFLIRTGDERAILYNNQSVNENWHVAKAFSLLYYGSNELRWDEAWEVEDVFEFRKLVMDMVLSTDMSKHFELLGRFKAKLASQGDGSEDCENGFPDPDATEDRTSFLIMAIKAADISAQSKRWHLCHKWAHCIQEEFFRQGDREKDLGMQPSPLCDRNDVDLVKSQIGFIDAVLFPLFIPMRQVLPAFAMILGRLQENRGMWEKELRKTKSRRYVGQPAGLDDDENKAEDDLSFLLNTSGNGEGPVSRCESRSVRVGSYKSDRDASDYSELFRSQYSRTDSTRSI